MPSNPPTYSKTPKRAATPKMTSSKTDLWVWNVPHYVNDSVLYQYFAQFCDPKNAASQVVFCTCRDGCGYVVFTDELAAYMAMESKLKIGKNILKKSFATIEDPFANANGNKMNNVPLNDMNDTNDGINEKQQTNVNDNVMNESIAQYQLYYQQWQQYQQIQQFQELQQLQKFERLFQLYLLFRQTKQVENGSVISDKTSETCDATTTSLKIEEKEQEQEQEKEKTKEKNQKERKARSGVSKSTLKSALKSKITRKQEKEKKRKEELKAKYNKIKESALSSEAAFTFIESTIGSSKDQSILIVGDDDFSISRSIIETIGSGHKVVCACDSDLMINSSIESLDRQEIQFLQRKTENMNQIISFTNGYNGEQSIVFSGIDECKLRKSLNIALNRHGRTDIGQLNELMFDCIIFPFPISFVNDESLAARNRMKQIFKNVNTVTNYHDGKAEVHFLMKIYSTRAQFESLNILEIANKWKLKCDPIVLKVDSSLLHAFPHFDAPQKEKETASQSFDYVGYYIMERKSN